MRRSAMSRTVSALSGDAASKCRVAPDSFPSVSTPGERRRERRAHEVQAAVRLRDGQGDEAGPAVPQGRHLVGDDLLGVGHDLEQPVAHEPQRRSLLGRDGGEVLLDGAGWVTLANHGSS